MDTPKSDRKFAFPEDLLYKAEKECGEYRVFPHGIEISKKAIRRYLNIWKTYEDTRTCVAINLLKENKVDLFFIVFQITDIINHFTNDREILFEAYKNADKNLGKLLNNFSNDTTVFIISDHGTKKIEREFYLNVWLRERGLLSFKTEGFCFKNEDAHSSVKELLKKIYIGKFPLFEKIIRHILVRVFTKTNRFSFGFWKTLCRFLPDQRYKFSNIDWQRTKVFITSKYGCLYINVSRNKEKQKNVNDAEERLKKLLIIKLKSINEPDTGKRVFQDVVRKEDCYDGKFLEYAPDIIAVPTDETIMISNNFVSPNNSLFGEPSSAMVGDHSMNGIIVVSGKHIRRGSKITDADVYDIVPTVLYLMGTPLPEYLDGRILKECIKVGFLKSHKPKYITRDYVRQKDKQKPSQQNEDDMRRRLKALGYI